MTFQSDNGKAFFWGPDKRSHEEIPHCTSTLDDIPSTNEWTRGEAEQNASEYAQGILLEVHDRLGQIPAASGRGIQKHAAFNNRDQSLRGVDRQRQSDALDFLLSGIWRTEDIVSRYVEEAVRRKQELNELCRRNTAQAQMKQRRKYDEKILQAKPYAEGQYVRVFQNVIPPKGTKKLLKKWRGPFMITEVHQQGLFYRLRKSETSRPITGRLKRTTEHGRTRVSTGGAIILEI